MKICGDHSQGETPGPIPNPEAKALYGDGTALDRVWESSASPLHTSEGSVPVWERAPPLFCAHARGHGRPLHAQPKRHPKLTCRTTSSVDDTTLLALH